MRFIGRFAWIGIVAIIALIVGFIVPVSASANGHGNADWQTISLSPKQFSHYCKHAGFSHGVVVVDPQDAYSLRCEAGDGSQQNINVTDVCNSTYGQWLEKATGEHIQLIDRLSDVGNPFGWGCMRDGGVAGSPDMTSWCQSRGMELFYWDGAQYPAYGWFCKSHDGRHIQGIPMDQVCVQTFGSDVLDRTPNVYDQNAWECRYIN